MDNNYKFYAVVQPHSLIVSLSFLMSISIRLCWQYCWM